MPCCSRRAWRPPEPAPVCTPGLSPRARGGRQGSPLPRFPSHRGGPRGRHGRHPGRLMARLGHSTVSAAMRYQHASRTGTRRSPPPCRNWRPGLSRRSAAPRASRLPLGDVGAAAGDDPDQALIDAAPVHGLSRNVPRAISMLLHQRRCTTAAAGPGSIFPGLDLGAQDRSKLHVDGVCRSGDQWSCH